MTTEVACAIIGAVGVIVVPLLIVIYQNYMKNREKSNEIISEGYTLITKSHQVFANLLMQPFNSASFFQQATKYLESQMRPQQVALHNYLVLQGNLEKLPKQMQKSFRNFYQKYSECLGFIQCQIISSYPITEDFMREVYEKYISAASNAYTEVLEVKNSKLWSRKLKPEEEK